MKPIEFNGGTKILLKLAEVILIFGAIISCTVMVVRMTDKLDGAIQGINAAEKALLLHVRSDWGLPHEVLMASRIKADNPETKFKWPDPVEVHNDVRRMNE